MGALELDGHDEAVECFGDEDDVDDVQHGGMCQSMSVACPSCHSLHAFSMPSKAVVASFRCTACNYEGSVLVDPSQQEDDHWCAAQSVEPEVLTRARHKRKAKGTNVA